MPATKTRTKRLPKDDPEQSRAFIKKAREIGADEDKSAAMNCLGVCTGSRQSQGRAARLGRCVMKLSDYLAMPNNAHKQQGNPGVEVNALYKTGDNFNCYLTATQAMNLAQNLLMKARLIQEEGIDDAIVHLWNTGQESERLYCGLNEARKGPRRKKD